MRNWEEGFRMRREQSLLLAEILDPDGQDRTIRRGLVAEALQVRLAERPFPRERLATDEPRPVAEALTDGDLGQLQGQRGHLVDSRHTRTALLAGRPRARRGHAAKQIG